MHVKILKRERGHINMDKIPIDTIISIAKEIGGNKKFQKTVFGTYSNGRPRSAIDAIKGEVISPEDQLLITRKLQKKKKKNKNKKKKKHKKDGITFYEF